MRKQLAKTVENIMEVDEKVVLLLADIGVYSCKSIFEKFPNRVYNMGCCEQSITNIASGLALSGMIPIFHTIAPFISTKILEELKVNFGYSNLGGNFISVGNSYDYDYLGTTHYAPDDVSILKTIPNMEIVLPSTSCEFDTLFNQSYNNGKPTYFRLAEGQNDFSMLVEFGKASKLSVGNDALIIIVGNMINKVYEATKDMDVTTLYYSTVEPFDYEILNKYKNKKIVLCEPYYSGALLYDIINNIDYEAKFKCIGVPHIYLDKYCTHEEQNENLGLTVENIKKEITDFIYE